MSKISKEDAKILKEIFRGLDSVYVFGSRVKDTHGKFSDLDVCLKDSISEYKIELLREKLENSDLPFKVDLVEYNKVSDAFKKIIDQDAIPIGKFLKQKP